MKNLALNIKERIFDLPFALKFFICQALIFVMVLSGARGERIFAYYTDALQINGSTTTGNIEVGIENLTVTNGEIYWTENEGSLGDGMIIDDTSDTFYFKAVNRSSQRVRYTIDLEIAWDSDLREQGKIFVYPTSYSDEEILSNIQNELSDGAIIGLNINDNQDIELSSGTRKGIKFRLDEGVLLDRASDNSYKEYFYKIFFFKDGELLSDPASYQNQCIAVNIKMNAKLDLLNADWSNNSQGAFRLTTIISGVFPIISEVSQPKVFFVTQASSINLASYATAEDTFDGDVTNKIVITSVPEFDKNKAGTYSVTYNVTNSFGNEAAPLTIHIIIWDFSKITSGNYHTLAMTSHGKVYTWGYNSYGQIGDGTTTYREKPQLVEGLNNIIDVAAGVDSSFALDSSGQAYAWGNNGAGRLGDGTVTTRRTPIKVIQPQGVKFTQIASNFYTVGGVTPNGDVYTWGEGHYGAAGTGDGTSNRFPTKINVSNVAYLALGFYNGAAVTRDGRLYTWGDNLHGQIGAGATGGTNLAPTLVPYFENTSINLISVSVGWYHMVAVSETGSAYTWGYGAEGRLGNGSTSDRNSPQALSLAFGVKKAIAAYYHTGFVADNGYVYFSGQNAYGKHGTGNATNHTTPQRAINITNATDVSLALDSSFALSKGTTVYGMGYGGTGVLGTGASNSSNTPLAWAFTPPSPSQLNQIIAQQRR